jgi:hypothetical protein
MDFHVQMRAHAHGVTYASGFGKVVQEGLQKGVCGIGRCMAPIYSGIDHFTFSRSQHEDLQVLVQARSRSGSTLFAVTKHLTLAL